MIYMLCLLTYIFGIAALLIAAIWTQEPRWAWTALVMVMPGVLITGITTLSNRKETDD